MGCQHNWEKINCLKNGKQHTQRRKKRSSHSLILCSNSLGLGADLGKKKPPAMRTKGTTCKALVRCFLKMSNSEREQI